MTIKRFFLCAFLFIVFLLALPPDLAGQVALSKDVVWGKPQIAFNGKVFESRLTMANESFDDPESGLPLVFFEMELMGWTGDSISVQIGAATYREANADETLVLANCELPPLIKYHVFEEQKRSFLRVTVAPYQRLAQTGRFQLMTDVSVVVDYQVAPSRSLAKNSSLTNGNSVLASGKWTKISVSQSGIHRISYSALSSMGFSNPASVKVFGQGGKLLPRGNSVARIDDLVENRILHHNNAIYFYAKGPVDWNYSSSKAMFIHKLHDYESKGFYFLSDSGEGRVVETTSSYNDIQVQNNISEFDDYGYYEKEITNLLGSGSQWLGERFGSGYLGSFKVDFNFANVVLNANARLSVEFVARTPRPNPSSFATFLDASSTAFQTVPINAVDFGSNTGDAAFGGSSVKAFVPAGDNTSVSMTYNYSTPNSAGYLDKIDIQVRRKLKMVSGQLSFRDVSSVGSGYYTKFNLETTDANAVVWDVSDYTSPKQVVLDGSGTSKWFVYPTDKLVEFVAFSPSASFPSPEVVGNVANQNLHGMGQVDYLIVTTSAFLNEANRLADFHRSNSGLTVNVATQDQIFNEFSSGCADITSIRSFVRMFYDRAGSNVDLMPKYLLLFGDGSFDNRNALKNGHLLTFQSDNSLNYSGTYVSDDFFGFLDLSEGNNMLFDALDVGIGRLTAETVSEAKTLVDKVVYYAQKQSNSNWRKLITFIGDDGDGNTHMKQADGLAKKVLANNPEFDLSKIYFDTYPKVTTSGGQIYPDVNLLVEKTIADGTLIFNYTGHGGPRQLSEERIVNTESITKWTNIDRLPLFVTATCEFSGYDSETKSAGEMVLLNPKGGGIALLSTTRVAWSDKNYAINDNFYTFALRKDDEGKPLRFGDICKLTKRATAGSVNKLNFSLLGDPALRLGTNSLGVKITELNAVPLSESLDTIKALSVVDLKGVVVNGDGTGASWFNGKATIAVYDKEKTIKTMGNNGATPFEYKAYESLLFSGKVAVDDGEFSLRFKMPKDIRYDVGAGRISMYATNDTLHASGYSHNVKVGSYVDEGADNQGPQLSLWMNSYEFVDGDVVNSTPLLLASVFDENGINTSNTGIGHDIVLLINGGDDGRYVLNSYYESTLNDYRSGTIQLQLPELPVGEHELSLRVWDNYNNSTTRTIRFTVSGSSKLDIKKTAYFPNPVKSGGDVSFKFTHNDPNAAISAICEIYSFDGAKVSTQKQLIYSFGIETQNFLVRAVNGNGAPLKSGFYLFKFELTSETGKKAMFGQKIIVAM